MFQDRWEVNTYSYACGGNAGSTDGIEVNEWEKELFVSLDAGGDVVVVDKALEYWVVKALSCWEQTTHDTDQVAGFFGVDSTLNKFNVLSDIYL